jgi:hypothetical protein
LALGNKLALARPLQELSRIFAMVEENTNITDAMGVYEYAGSRLIRWQNRAASMRLNRLLSVIASCDEFLLLHASIKLRDQKTVATRLEQLGLMPTRACAPFVRGMIAEMHGRE